MEFYEVGGCVRDEILGGKSKDIDFTVVLSDEDIRLGTSAHGEPDPFRIMVRNLTKVGFKIFLETPEFLTARAQFPSVLSDNPSRKGLTADFVLARKESEYTDGRRPDTVMPGTLMDDLSRRDFTMNAVAKAADGSYIDPFNGRADIEARIIRTVGNPLDRLTEDALRAVRALRFAVTKNFVIEESLYRAIQSTPVLNRIRDNISDERIQVELSKMFRFDTVHSLWLLSKFPKLTEAMFSGSVSLDATMKTRGRGK